MAIRSGKARLPVLAVMAMAAVLAGAGLAAAQDHGPFSIMAGSWSGGGNIVIGNGAQEPIRCRAEYRVPKGGISATLELRCASDSYKFELQGNVRYQNGEVVGDWSERTRGTAGKVEGLLKGDHVDVRVHGNTFSALLSLTTRGDKQAISIRAPVGKDMSEANITLTRRG